MLKPLAAAVLALVAEPMWPNRTFAWLVVAWLVLVWFVVAWLAAGSSASAAQANEAPNAGTSTRLRERETITVGLLGAERIDGGADPRCTQVSAQYALHK